MKYGVPMRVCKMGRLLMAPVFNARGVCLTEVMLSLTTGAIVLAAALDTFNVMHRQTIQQERAVTNQQDLRIGLEVLEQEIRLATSDSIVAAAPDQFLFNANINAQYTTTTASIVSGQLTVPVQDGSGWGGGKTVKFCSRAGCEIHSLARAGQKYLLTLAEPARQPFPAGTSVEVINRVTYYTKPNERGTLTLMRMVDGGASGLIGELEQISFSYWSDRGDSTNLSSSIKRVVVDLKLKHSSSKIAKEVALRS